MKSKVLTLAVLFVVMLFLLPGSQVAESGGLEEGSVPAQPETLTQANITAFVDHFVEEEMAAAHAPGLVITVVHQGQVVLAKGYGLADQETGRPMTPQTNIRAGSISKPVTSAAVLQLVEQGLIDLNSPASDYIDDLPLEDEFGPAATIAQLLTLKGGYPNVVVGTHTTDLSAWQPLDEYLDGNLPQRVIPPGKVHSYTSWEHALLGRVMAEVTGQSFDQAIDQYLLQHLGMADSTYSQPLPEAVVRNLAAGYWYTGGQYEQVPLDYVRLTPGIALVTTAEDMGRFMMALLDGGRLDGKQALSPGVIQGILNRQEEVHPYSRGRTYGLSEINLGGRQVLYHDGNGIGHGSRMILAPEQELGIFLSINHRPLAPDISYTPANRFMKDLGTALLERYLPATTGEAPSLQPLPDAARRASRYAGQYRLAETPQQDFFKLGALLDNVNVRDNKDGTITIGSTRYQEVEPLLFQSLSDPGFFVVFADNEDGRIGLLTFGGTGSYLKVRWYESLTVQLVLVTAMALIFISFVILMPFSRPRHWLVWLVSLLNIIFLVGLALMMTTSDLVLFFKTIPLGTRLLFLLPWISGVLTLTLPVFLVKIWREQAAVWRRAHVLLVTLAAFSFSWFVYNWHLYL